MKKTVKFKPTRPHTAEQWVAAGAPSGKEPQVAMKRFTIDVPIELHTRIKVACAGRGQKMADMLRELLEREFAKS